MSLMSDKIKNKEDTKQKLITAFGSVLAGQGFNSVGVNAIARKAGVNKVLIYRYFDGLDGLIKAYAASKQFWPTVEDLLGSGQAYEELRSRPFSEIIGEVFRRYADELKSRPDTLEILAWETVSRNSLTVALEEVREAFGLELMEHLKQVDAPPADWQAIANIFSGAIHYLALRARKIDTFTGMDLSDEQGWERLFASIEFLVSNLTSAQQQ